MKTKLTFLALATAFTVPAFAQELPTTGTVNSRLGKLELITSDSTVQRSLTLIRPGCCRTSRKRS